ncbi:hypothetical protein FGW37_26745 [Streptomyces rectiverticillatus]|nr:hypothetical protein FGW37_26745 [Streptomyces rectiverticillatus]
MTPPIFRSWARRGHTPVIRVRGRSRCRISIAALTCYKPGQCSRLVYRTRRHEDHKNARRRSFAWTDYRDLLVAAHQQLGGPLVVIWDNLNVHRSEVIDGCLAATGLRRARCSPEQDETIRE